MLRRLARRLTYANVVATLALVAALGTGGAYAANTIRSSDIVDGEVKSADVKDESLTTFDISTMLGVDVVDETLTGDDVKNGSLGTADIAELHGSHLVPGSVTGSRIAANTISGTHIVDGSLKDEDIAQGTFVDFSAHIDGIPAGLCTTGMITGVNAWGDHLLLTPDLDTANPNGQVTYDIQETAGERAALTACNHGNTAIPGRTAKFSLLVIDAG